MNLIIVFPIKQTFETPNTLFGRFRPFSSQKKKKTNYNMIRRSRSLVSAALSLLLISNDGINRQR